MVMRDRNMPRGPLDGLCQNTSLAAWIGGLVDWAQQDRDDEAQ